MLCPAPKLVDTVNDINSNFYSIFVVDMQFVVQHTSDLVPCFDTFLLSSCACVIVHAVLSAAMASHSLA